MSEEPVAWPETLKNMAAAKLDQADAAVRNFSRTFDPLNTIMTQHIVVCSVTDNKKMKWKMLTAVWIWENKLLEKIGTFWEVCDYTSELFSGVKYKWLCGFGQM